MFRKSKSLVVLPFALATLGLLGACGAEPAFVEEDVGGFVVPGLPGRENKEGEPAAMDANRAEDPAAGSPGLVTGERGEGGPTDGRGGARVAPSRLPSLGTSLVSLDNSEDDAPSESDGRTGVPEGSTDGAGGGSTDTGGSGGTVGSPGTGGSGGSGSGSNGGTGAGGDGSKDLPSQCKSMARAGAKVVHVTSANARIEDPENSILVFHLSGNRPHVRIALQGSRSYEGLCILATGNQARMDVTLDTRVNKITYVGHGNQSQGSISMHARGWVEQGRVTLAGNAARLTMDPVQLADCSHWAVDKAKGKGSAFVCK